MAEIWKPVPSKPGIMASSEGRVLLPAGYAPLPNGGYRLYTPSPTNGVVYKAKKAAQHVYLGVKSRRFGAMKVHRLVCEAFHGERPFPKAVVIHIDENGLNNKPSNLKWGTQKENLNAPGFKEYCRSRTGDHSPRTIWARNRRVA